jgi:hypothetical protein
VPGLPSRLDGAAAGHPPACTARPPARPQVILDALLGSGVHSEALQAEAGAKEALRAAMERRSSSEYAGACARAWWLAAAGAQAWGVGRTGRARARPGAQLGSQSAARPPGASCVQQA